jgi:hypothetical protein
MNTQLFTLQIIAIIFAWFVIGAVFDFIKFALMLGERYINFIPRIIKGASRSAKLNFVRDNFFFRLTRLALTVIELFFTLLEQVIKGGFSVVIGVCAIVFFIPYLITNLIIAKISGNRMKSFLENLDEITLKTESNIGENSTHIEINGNIMSGDIVAGRDIHEVDSKNDETIDLIGSSDGHKQTNNKADEVYADLKKILNEIGKKFFKISIGHPKLISKGYESPFVVQLYFEELTNIVKMKIKEIVGENYTEHVYDTELKFGQVVKIKLFSPDIIFPEAIAKKLDLSVNSLTFLGKPLDTCQPREHKVVLSILDNKTGIEYQSETFSIKVADYAFDHVSRPLLSKVSTFVLGIGSFVMFILALFEQIDKTVGLTSGTAAGVLAVVVYTNFYNLYQRIRPNTP